MAGFESFLIVDAELKQKYYMGKKLRNVAFGK